MAARGGMGARWCSDCGELLNAHAGPCATCGLEPRSLFAAELEKANAAIHEVRERKAALEEREREWLSHREVLRSRAPRQAKGAVVAPLDLPLPFADPGATPAQATAGPSPSASNSRPARRLTAPVLLGISGAALLIASGVIFVAVSWSTYVPAARMAVLVAFAAAFAWLARTLTKHDFGTIGGALGVVSAGFVGVGVFALRWGPDGPGRFTVTAAALAAGLAGHLLSRLGIKGTGMLGVAAVVLAAELGAVEAAVLADGAPAVGVAAPWAAYALVAAIAGAVVALTHRVWGVPAHTAVAAAGGTIVSLAGAAAAVVSILVEQGPAVLAMTALVVAIAATASLTMWRPSWAAWALSGVLVTGAMAVVGAAGGLAGAVVCAGSVTALAIAAAARWLPFPWRRPLLAGLIPAGIAALWPLTVVVAMALLSVHPEAILGTVAQAGGVEGLAWHGAALLAIAAIDPSVRGWRKGASGASGAKTASTIGGLIAGVGLLGLALAAALAWGGPELLSVPAVAAAAVWWFTVRLWGAGARAVRAGAIALAGAAGLHGALMAAADTGSHAWPWAVVGAGLSIAALCAVAWRPAQAPGFIAAGAASLVFVSLATAVTWQLGEPDHAVIAAGAAAVVAMWAARVVPPALSSAVAVGASPAAALACLALAVGTVGEAALALGVITADPEYRPWWIAALAAIVVALGPALASATARASGVKTHAWVAAVSGGALLAAALTGTAWTLRAIGIAASAEDIARGGAWAAPAVLALAVAAVFVVTLAGPLRPAKAAMGIGGTAVVTAAGLIGLGFVAFAEPGLPVAAVEAVLCGALALAVAARWYPAVTFAPAVLLGSLAAPAWLVDDFPLQAGAAAAVTVAVTAWAAALLLPRWRRWVLLGGAGVGVTATLALISALSYVHLAIVEAVVDAELPWRGWQALVIAASAAALLAWPRARKRAAWVSVVTLGVLAGHAPLPVGWIVLVAAGAAVVEPSVRWNGKASLRPAVGTTLVTLALLWTGGERVPTAVVLGALAIVSLWAAFRAGDRQAGERTAALFIAPVAGASSVWLALLEWEVQGQLAATLAVGVALAMSVVLVHTGLDRGTVAPWTVGAATVVGPFLTGDPAFAAVVVLVAAAAWLGLAAAGMRWTRWVSLGLLTPAAALLMASLEVTTWEAYTAAPALTMIGIGLWWMRRDRTVRSYKALAPGLALALVPSYLAMAAAPATWWRPGALLVAAVVLAVVGVWRRWFAPLVATATTAVAVALTQVFVADPLVPQWAAITFIGAVLLGLGLAAERIRAMR